MFPPFYKTYGVSVLELPSYKGRPLIRRSESSAILVISASHWFSNVAH